MTEIQTANQERKYRLQLMSSILVGIVLCVGGIWVLLSKRQTGQGIKTWLLWLIIIFGMVSLLLGLKEWFLLTRGNTQSVIKQAILLKDGELTIDEPSGSYELWIFCQVPFFYLYGDIKFKRDSENEGHSISVPRRSPWLMWWWRSRLYGPPIVWRSLKDRPDVAGHCRINFSLRPSFSNTIYSDVLPVRDVELVTILVKSV